MMVAVKAVVLLFFVLLLRIILHKCSSLTKLPFIKQAHFALTFAAVSQTHTADMHQNDNW